MKKITLLLISVTLLLNTVAINSYWVSSISLFAPDAVNDELSTPIGEWDYIPPFDVTEPYEPGDTFVYDGEIWIVTETWFDPDEFLDEFGNVNQDYLYPYGPVQENTIYWRVYNTYYTGDIVIHNNYSWIARHEGANSQEPGTSGNGWDRMSNEYFVYNTYTTGEVVSYNGIYYESKHNGANSVTPGTNIYAWAPITTTFNPGTSYSNKAYVLYEGLPWKSLINNNIGNIPTLGSTYWIMALKY
ncbi:MAG: hypothetical protein PHD47_00895 [Acholeplasmataceae bacterium]|nr:hypothetical protein [Acholeplasmataceae bacterium]